MKFWRDYRMTIQKLDPITGEPIADPIIITYPLTLQFSVDRSNYSGANKGNFSIYGLSASSREAIFYDWYLTPGLVRCTLDAGYRTQGSLCKIFSGDIHLAYTERQGVELITRIEALDGGYAISTSAFRTPFSFGSRTPFAEGVKQIVQAGMAPSVTPGFVLLDTVEKQPEDFVAGSTGVDNPWEMLQKCAPADAHVFIDDGKVHILGPQDSFPTTGDPVFLSSDQGLLNTPKATQARVVCDCMFEPTFVIGQPVILFSDFNPVVNGPYTVIGLAHNGTISAVESGDAITSLTLLRSERQTPATTPEVGIA